MLMAVLDHVGVRVTDLDRAIRFYEEIFGFEMVDRRMLTGNEGVETAAMKVGPDNLVFLLYNPAFGAPPPSRERTTPPHPAPSAPAHRSSLTSSLLITPLAHPAPPPSPPPTRPLQ